MISIKNFVSADIEVLEQPKVFDGFKTTIYFAPVTVNTPDVADGNFVVVSSLTEFEAKCSTSNTAVSQSISEYFENGGTSLCVVAPTVFTLEGFKEDMRKITQVLDNYFFVVIANSLTNDPNGYQLAEVFNIANFCSDNGWTDDDEKSLNTMRVCFTTNSTDFILENSLTNTLAVVKYSTLDVSGELIDAALLVGAYFSQIDTSVSDPIEDYNFTPEVLGSEHFEDVDQATFNKLVRSPATGYYNFIGNVANKILNIGGDYCSAGGISISLDFGAACIERDLNYANIELLFGKLPLTNEGQSKLISAIRSQLTKYVDSGFLETDTVYSGETKSVTYNGTKYTVISTGDVLPLGYKIFYVPINAISATDKSAKRFPYIYVALQTVHGARLIEVNGSII